MSVWTILLVAFLVFVVWAIFTPQGRNWIERTRARQLDREEQRKMQFFTKMNQTAAEHRVRVRQTTISNFQHMIGEKKRLGASPQEVAKLEAELQRVLAKLDSQIS